MDNNYDEVLLRMKTMDTLLDNKLEEVQNGIDVLDAYCYTFRMYTEWMMGTVGPSATTYSEFAKLKDGFLTFEVLLTLDDRDVTNYVIYHTELYVKKFRGIVGDLIVELEELM